jgi:hypothetical protein
MKKKTQKKPAEPSEYEKNLAIWQEQQRKHTDEVLRRQVKRGVIV